MKVSHEVATPEAATESARTHSLVSVKPDNTWMSVSRTAPLVPEVVPADVETYFAQRLVTDASAPSIFGELVTDPFDAYQSALPENSFILDTLQAFVLTTVASLSSDLHHHRKLKDLANRLGETSGHLKMLQGVRNMNDNKLKELAALEAEKATCAQSFLDEKQRTEDETAYIEGLCAEETTLWA
ncbi:uncharacterized protein LOC127255683 [Andrographis paniculata]|uniref:uncharacterized protein LOC127255683 n=1 Tax=Andrographis paniculata TaxID=175694 RepID=UPI0021E88994|nr:uncharacterized protein LOC127255683 [Andrographis paniculata]